MSKNRKEVVVDGRFKIAAVVVAWIVALGAGQSVFAQVEWTIGGVVVPPEPGWDRHVLGDVVFDGTTYHMYLIGGPGQSPVDSVWKVGHWAWSDTLGTWEPDLNNPVLVPEPGQWDGYTIGSIAVLYHEGMFHMWYGAAATHLAPTYAGHATSSDGSVWIKDYAHNPLEGLVPGAPGAWDDYGMAPGAVIVEGSDLRMWYFAFQGGYSGPFRIGHASSTNGGLTWVQEPDAPVLEASEPWEGDVVYWPTVVRHGGSYHMWYTARVLGVSVMMGYADSSDGLQWRKWPDNPALTPVGCNYLDSIAVLLEGNTIHGWVSNCDDIRDATSSWFFADDFEIGTTDLWSFTMP